MKTGKAFLSVLTIIFTLFPLNTLDAEENWAVTIYGTFQTQNDFWSQFYSPDFNTSYYLLALALSRKIYSFSKHVDLELEGQAVKHMGEQHHWEFNGLLTARWLTFPWNKYIVTSIAIGDGLSYATRTPELEEKLHNKTSQFLNYLMVEMTFALPDIPQWSIVCRIHHRSGIFGLFDGVEGGSNSLGVGLKYRF